jgi:hypothetical protein
MKISALVRDPPRQRLEIGDIEIGRQRVAKFAIAPQHHGKAALLAYAAVAREDQLTAGEDEERDGMKLALVDQQHRFSVVKQGHRATD